MTVRGEFGPADTTPVSVDGFCDSADGSVFRIRFMPIVAGPHSYSITYRQGDFTRTYNGTFTARDAKRSGQLRVDPGSLAVGHFNRRTRPGHTDRMFRGLIDEIRVHGSRLDSAGALTLDQIRAVQRSYAQSA